MDKKTINQEDLTLLIDILKNNIDNLVDYIKVNNLENLSLCNYYKLHYIADGLLTYIYELAENVGD